MADGALEMRVIYQDRDLRLFHGGYMSLGMYPPERAIQFTPKEARCLAADLNQWADKEEELFFP